MGHPTDYMGIRSRESIYPSASDLRALLIDRRRTDRRRVWPTACRGSQLGAYKVVNTVQNKGKAVVVLRHRSIQCSG